MKIQYVIAIVFLNSSVWSMKTDKKIDPRFCEKVDPNTVIRSVLALPDKSAQRVISPEIKESMGLTAKHLLPVTSHKYEMKRVTTKSAQRSLNKAPYDKSIRVRGGCLTSEVFNNKTFNTLDTSEITEKMLTNNTVNRISSEEEKKVLKENLKKKLDEVYHEKPCDTVVNGTYIFGIDEKLELRILPRVVPALYGKEDWLDPGLLDQFCRSYLLRLKVKEFLHHDALFGQKNLLLAGEMNIQDGKITSVNNGSGHYLPKGWNIYYGIKPYYETHKEAFTPDFKVDFICTMSNEERAWNKKEYANEPMTWKEFEDKAPWKKQLEYNFNSVIDYTAGNLERGYWKQKISNCSSDPCEADEQEALKVLKLDSAPRYNSPQYLKYIETTQSVKEERDKYPAKKYQEKYGKILDQPTSTKRKQAFYGILKQKDEAHKERLIKDAILNFRSGNVEKGYWKAILQSPAYKIDQEKALEKLGLATSPDVGTPEYKNYLETARSLKKERIEQRAKEYQTKYRKILHQSAEEEAT